MQYIPSLQPLWVKQTKDYMSGVNGSSIRQDTLCRHADSSGHPSAVKAERAAKHPDANIVMCLPTTTADCERGFSLMKRYKTALRKAAESPAEQADGEV